MGNLTNHTTCNKSVKRDMKQFSQLLTYTANSKTGWAFNELPRKEAICQGGILRMLLKQV